MAHVRNGDIVRITNESHVLRGQLAQVVSWYFDRVRLVTLDGKIMVNCMVDDVEIMLGYVNSEDNQEQESEDLQ